MHDVPLLVNITLALIVAFFGGMIARWIGHPTIVGYLLAGIAIGPFTPGFVGDLVRNKQLIPNPKSGTVFEAGDRIGVIGEKDQIAHVQNLMDH